MLKGSMHPQLGIQTTDKYIINVSAMEGKFYRHKSPNQSAKQERHTRVHAAFGSFIWLGERTKAHPSLFVLAFGLLLLPFVCPFSPHTNAAKAALNMLTRTSAQSYAADRIYMNSVDTGWINVSTEQQSARDSSAGFRQLQSRCAILTCTGGCLCCR